MANNSHVFLPEMRFLNIVSIKNGVTVKIGVLSDTHIVDMATAKRLADMLLFGPFADVDAIVHAGDAVIAELADCFAPLPWYAVRGNMDHTLYDVPISRIVNVEEKKVGMIHGWGSHGDIEQRVLAHFSSASVDVVIFGHSHQPVCRKVGSVLLLNPGSPTDRRKAEHHTVGLLTIEEDINAEIIPIDW